MRKLLYRANRALIRANGHAALAWLPAHEANLMRECAAHARRLDPLALRASERAKGTPARQAIRLWPQ